MVKVCSGITWGPYLMIPLPTPIPLKFFEGVEFGKFDPLLQKKSAS